MKLSLLFLGLAMAASQLTAHAQDHSGQVTPHAEGRALLLPSESRGLPLVQRVGRFHSALISCKVVPGTESEALRAEAKTRMPTGQAAQFDREDNLGFQGGLIAWQGMNTIARVSYCRQVIDTWQAEVLAGR